MKRRPFIRHVGGWNPEANVTRHDPTLEREATTREEIASSGLTPALARDLLADATPGEWRAVSQRVSMRGVATAIETDEVRITSHDPVVRLADARAMAAAPDLARAYLAAIERAEAAERERDALRALVKSEGPR